VATAGLLEIRNVGLVEMPFAPARVALVVRLDRDAPRFVEQAESMALAGVEVPFLRLWPETPTLALRVEWALAQHGTA
jgi:hypothetical protein